MIETCGIYLFSTRKKGLLICHATRTRADQWSIPKGLKDDGENGFEAASRELKEECGIDLHKLNILSCTPLPERHYKKQKKKLYSWLIVTDSSIPDEDLHCTSMVNGKYPEIDKYGWASFEQAEQFLHESQIENLSVIREALRKEGL